MTLEKRRTGTLESEGSTSETLSLKNQDKTKVRKCSVPFDSCRWTRKTLETQTYLSLPEGFPRPVSTPSYV